MPLIAVSIRGALSVLLAYGLLTAVIVAWIWLIQRLREGWGVLPQGPLRIVPWREGSVLLVVLTFLGVQFYVETMYLGLREKYGLSVGPSVPAIAPAANGADSKRATTAAKGNAPREKAKGVDTDLLFSPTDKLAITSIVNVVLLIVVPLLLRGTSRARLRDLGLERAGFGRNILIGTVAFLTVTPCVYLIFFVALHFYSSSQHPLMEMLAEEMSPGKVALALLSAVVLAPISEELLFRGVLQGWLTRLFARADGPDQPSEPEQPRSPYEAEPDSPAPPAQPKRRSRRRAASMIPVVVTSALFAAVHAPQMPAPIALFFLSFALGTLCQRTGSLIPSITLHSLFNALSTVALLLATPKPP